MRSRLASQPRLPHLIIEAVQPDLDCGRSPVKRIAGENCIVSADIFRDGSAAIAAVIKWRPINAESLAEAPMTYLDNDRWRGEFPLETNTRYFFMIEAWTRAFVSWRDYFVKKAATKLEVGSNLAEGIALLDEICDRAYGPDRDLIAFYNQRIRKLTDPTLAAKIVVEKELEIAIARHEERADAVTFGET